MDSYDRKARLYPAACVLAPVTLLAVLLFTLPQWWSGLLGFLAAGGFHVLVIQVVRDRGTKVQPQLWKTWGVTPTTAKLRWAGAENKVLHQHRHADVAAATGVNLPTAEEEAVDSADADIAYDAAASLLREKTRNESDFPLVKAELINYGYRRNLYACRVHGVVIAALVLIIQLGMVALSWKQIFDAPVTLLLIGAAATFIWLLVWIFVVTPNFVRRSADRYADTLISAASGMK